MTPNEKVGDSPPPENALDTESKVKELLNFIEMEKRQPKPNRKQIRQWFNEIVALKEDWRIVHNADRCSKFQIHTSTRTWTDDA